MARRKSKKRNYFKHLNKPVTVLIVIIALSLVVVLGLLPFADQLTGAATTLNLKLGPEVDDENVRIPNDLWVWLEVPETIPTVGETFWADVYVSFEDYKGLDTFKITLESNSKVEFTPNKKIAKDYLIHQDYLYYYNNPSEIMMISLNTKNNNFPYPSSLTQIYALSNKKWSLVRLEMKVKEQGMFYINLDKKNSGATYKIPDGKSYSYTLKLANTRVIKNVHCVPNQNACSEKNCGIVDDGCGGVVKCSSPQSVLELLKDGAVCVDNTLKFPADLLSEKDKDSLGVSNLPDKNDQDALKGVSAALQSKNPKDDKSLKECSGQDTSNCKYSKLNAILGVLTDWFKSQK